METSFDSLDTIDVADVLRASFNKGAFDREQNQGITTKARFIAHHSPNVADHNLILDMYRAYSAGYRKQFS